MTVSSDRFIGLAPNDATIVGAPCSHTLVLKAPATELGRKRVAPPPTRKVSYAPSPSSTTANARHGATPSGRARAGGPLSRKVALGSDRERHPPPRQLLLRVLLGLIKDGLVWREEQAHAYGRTNDSLPDFNPRDCQKGGRYYRELTYAPSRIKHPMRRGGGRWRRITWEEAPNEVAEALLEVVQKKGPECIPYDNGISHIEAGPSTASKWHFSNLLGATTLDSVAGTGDMPMGGFRRGSSPTWTEVRTTGSIRSACSSGREIRP